MSSISEMVYAHRAGAAPRPGAGALQPTAGLDLGPYRLQFKPDTPSVPGAGSCPEIIECYGTPRHSRVRVGADEVAVPAQPPLRVRDLSSTGVALLGEESRLRSMEPLRLLTLSLPGGQRLQLRARVVRMQREAMGCCLLALRFEAVDAADQARLDAFVFGRHPAFGRCRSGLRARESV